MPCDKKTTSFTLTGSALSALNWSDDAGHPGDRSFDIRQRFRAAKGKRRGRGYLYTVEATREEIAEVRRIAADYLDTWSDGGEISPAERRGLKAAIARADEALKSLDDSSE